MLIPDGISPDNCIYANAAYVLEVLLKEGEQTVADLYCNVCRKHKMTFSVFTLCLDWLYLIDCIMLKEGRITLCS